MLIVLSLVLAFIGFLDATYLTAVHYTGSNLVCYISTDCDSVTTSKYATIGFVPVSLIGSGYYLFALVLLLIYLMEGFRKVLSWLQLLFAVAFLFSLYFVYLQLFVIHALCFYCVTSATVTTLLLISSIILKLPPKAGKGEKNDQLL